MADVKKHQSISTQAYVIVPTALLLLGFSFGIVGIGLFILSYVLVRPGARLWGGLSVAQRVTIKVVIDGLICGSVLIKLSTPMTGFAYTFAFIASMIFFGGYKSGIEQPSARVFSAIMLSTLWALAAGATTSLVLIGSVYTLNEVLFFGIFVPSILIAYRTLLSVAATSLREKEILNRPDLKPSVLLVPDSLIPIGNFVIEALKFKGITVSEIWVTGKVSLTYINGVRIRTINSHSLPEDISALSIVSLSENGKLHSQFKELADKAGQLGGKIELVDLFGSSIGPKPIDAYDLSELWSRLFRDERKFTLNIDETVVSSDDTILISGGAGSIGSTILEVLLGAGYTDLHVLDSAEVAIYTIAEQFRDNLNRGDLTIHLADIKDQKALERLLGEIKPKVVFHAAACKHVDIVEDNHSIAFKTNVVGTANMLRSLDPSVSQFTLVSTDKAVNPTNFMGATKRLAELLVFRAQKQSSNEANPCRFSVVRFGNVFGSSGSAPLKFIKQISMGEKVTLTHNEMTRYFMSIKEACFLVIKASIARAEVESTSYSAAGICYVLDMGRPVRIRDLIAALVQIAGKKIVPEPRAADEIALEISGLRPGEKLFEELSHREELIPSMIQGVFIAEGYDVEKTDLREEFSNVFINKKEMLKEYLEEFARMSK